MRRSTLHTDRHSKKGITLVELIVAMTLTAMFAVVCVSLINPISRIYQRTTKITKAQLLADTIVDAIRKECDDADNGTITAAWIAKLGDSEPDDRKLINPGPEGVKEPSGNVLVFQRNNNYCEAIYACVEVSDTNKANVESTSNPDSIKLAGHSVVRLFDTSGNDNRKEGLVHFGYYQSINTSDGIKPERAYDYTNPVLASTYGNYTVTLEFTKLVFKKVNGNNVCPAYVNCTVNVEEGSKTVYSRDAVISFSANGSGKGAGGGGGQTTPSKIKDIEVIVKWDDKGIKDRRPAEGILVTLTNGSGTVIKTHPFSNADIIKGNQQKFVFKGIDISNGYKVYQTEDPAATGYAPVSIKQTAKGFVLTNKYSSVTLLSGPAFNDVLKSVSGNNIKVIEKVIFGGPEIGNGVSLNSASKISNVAVDSQGNITDEYKLYYFAGSKTAYVISYSSDGKFIAHSNCSSMFADCEGLMNITWNDDSASHDFIINTANTTNMASMFKNCKAMTQFNLKNLVQSNCASTASMFENCQHGSQLNGISTWNTDSVTDMSKMFFNYGIYHTDDSDGSIDVSSFNFKSCKTMQKMFSNDVNDELEVAEIKFPLSTASSLKNMNNVTTMEQMFYSNAKLKKITNFNCMDCQNLKNVNKMFDYCGELTELDLNNFKMPKCDLESQYSTTPNQQGGFLGCNSLEVIILDGWDISSETNLRDFFGYRSNLKKVSLKDCTAPNLESVEGLFYQCTSLEEAYLPNFVGEKCETLRSIFYNCKNLRAWDISGWKTGHVKYMRTAFYYTNYDCATPLKLDLSSWDFDSAIDMSEMCSGAGFSEVRFKAHAKDLNSLMSFNNVTSIRLMFSSCTRLTKIENFNYASFNSLTKYIEKPDEHNSTKKYGSDSIFSGCSSLTSIDVSGLNLHYCESVNSMFNNCSALTDINMDDVDLNACIKFDNMFTNCSSAEKIHMNRILLGEATNLSFVKSAAPWLEFTGARLPKITSFFQCFKDSAKLVHITFDGAQLPVCESFSQMFYNCSKLVYASFGGNMVIPNLSDVSYMFYKCTKLASFNMDDLNTSNIVYMDHMFDTCSILPIVDLSGKDLSNVRTMDYMFQNCKGFTGKITWVLDLPACEQFVGVFKGCTGLTEVTLDGSKFYECSSINDLFNGCSGLTRVNMNSVELKKCVSANGVFSNCSNVSSINMHNIYLNMQTSIGFVALNNAGYSLDLSGATLTGITSLENTFKEKTIVTANFLGTKLNNCSSYKNMFYKCAKLTTVKFSPISEQNIVCESMFSDCYSLANFIWTDGTNNWDTSNVTNMKRMFYNCCFNGDGNQTTARSINIECFNFNNVITMQEMFSCSNNNIATKDLLNGIVLPKGNNAFAANATSVRAMFKYRVNTKSIENLGYFKVDIVKLTAGVAADGNNGGAGDLFYQFGAATLDLRSFDFNSVRKSDVIFNMFKNNKAIVTIYVAQGTDSSQIDTSNRTIFTGCNNIRGGSGTTFKGADAKYARVDGGPNSSTPGYFTYDPNLPPLEGA